MPHATCPQEHTKASPYPWQKQQWKSLNTARLYGKLPQAVLLSGASGLGKCHFAHALSQKILCSAESSDETCGSCRNCQFFAAQTHPDYSCLSPAKSMSVISTAQVQKVMSLLGQTPQSATHRVVNIAHAETLNMASTNRLLKTLEEPTSCVYFILVTHRPAALPRTLYSRCQNIRFPIPPQSVSQRWLTKHLPAHEASKLLLLAGNRPLQALKWAEGHTLPILDSLLKHTLLFLQAEMDPLDFAHMCAQSDQDMVSEVIGSLILDILRLQQDPTAGIGYAAQRSALCNIAHKTAPTQLLALANALVAMQRQLQAKITLHIPAAWEAICLKVIDNSA